MALTVSGLKRALVWDFPALATLEQVLGAAEMAQFAPGTNLWHLAALLYALNAGQRLEEAETAASWLLRIAEASQAEEAQDKTADLAEQLRQAQAMLTVSRISYTQFVRLLPGDPEEVEKLRAEALAALEGGE